MAGAFSGHLLNGFNNGPAQPGTPTVVTSGAMSFDARAHGTPAPSFPSILSPLSTPHAPFGFAPLTEDSATAKNIATLQAKLNKKLGPEYISQRPGPGGGPKLTYAEGWKIINLANEVFGFNGWSSSIVSIATDFVDYSQESKKFNVGVTAIIRVTLRDGAYHEDVGYGLLENSKSKAAALDKCKKEAITDALKRTLRNFGNLLGNCLYDKSYAQEVIKIKVPPAKFDKNELHRRPEFEERIPGSLARVAAESPSMKCDDPCIKVEHLDRQSETPITYVPRHMRQEVAAAQQAQTSARIKTIPPHKASPHSHVYTSASGSGMTDAQKPSGPMPPAQMLVQAQHPPPPRASRPVATSPLAQTRRASGHSVSFAEPVYAADQNMGDTTAQENVDDEGDRQNGEDEDAFPLSTQDDAFLATVDLGEGDLGRPIDFEEGMGVVGTLDISVLDSGADNEVHRIPVAPQPHPRVGGNMESSSSGPLKTSTRDEGQVPEPSTSGKTNVNASFNPNAGANGGHSRAQHRNGSPNVMSTSVPVSASVSASTSTSSTRVGSLVQDAKRRPVVTSTDGLQFTGVNPQQQPQPPHAPKAVVPACVRTGSATPQMGPTNALKRNVDVMQSSSGPSSRPPIQGMGLAQRQHQLQQQNMARRPPESSGDHDPKRLKR